MNENPLTSKHLSILKQYKPETHGIEQDTTDPVVEELIQDNYLSWIPPIFGSNRLYGISEKGRKAVIHAGN